MVESFHDSSGITLAVRPHAQKPVDNGENGSGYSSNNYNNKS